MLHVYHLLLLTPSSTPNLQASAGTELLLKPLSVANKPQPGSTCLDWSHILYTEKKAFSFNELFNLVYGFIFNFLQHLQEVFTFLCFQDPRRRIVSVFGQSATQWPYTTSWRTLTRDVGCYSDFFCTLTSNLTTKTLFNVTVLSPFIYFCTFICNCWRCLSIRWSIKSFICPMFDLWNHIKGH